MIVLARLASIALCTFGIHVDHSLVQSERRRGHKTTL